MRVRLELPDETQLSASAATEAGARAAG
jgi:hypothetical protein